MSWMDSMPDNDHLSRMLGHLVPDRLQGSDRFLDLVTWNIRWFDHRSPARVRAITSVLGELNADVFVFQEIKFGALNSVARELRRQGAGDYWVAYGSTGGAQRIAFMWDRDWVRPTAPFDELFPEMPLTCEKHLVFPRLPLHGQFIATSKTRPFRFELVGVHLKSQRGGGELQRKVAATLLGRWIAEQHANVVVAGDWNAPPDSAAWRPLRQLERRHRVAFAHWNPEGEPSHVMGRALSRLDLIAVSEAAERCAASHGTSVVQWEALPGAEKVRGDRFAFLSDHRPVLTRFYWSRRKKAAAPIAMKEKQAA